MYEAERQFRALLHGLTNKEHRFVEEYLIDCNATRAAKKAGYSEKCAKQIGYENLTKPYLAAAVEAGLDAIAARCALDADRLVEELASVTLSNLSHYRIDDEGYVVVREGAPPEAMRALQSTRRKKTVRTDEQGNTITTYETEFRLWDKMTAATLLGKRLKLFVERVEVENPQDEAYRLLLKQIKTEVRVIPPLPLLPSETLDSPSPAAGDQSADA